jgi:hypothetical protein
MNAWSSRQRPELRGPDERCPGPSTGALQRRTPSLRTRRRPRGLADDRGDCCSTRKQGREGRAEGCRDSSPRKARRRERPVVRQQPPVVPSAQFGDRRQSPPRGRRNCCNRGEPVVRSPTEAIARRPTARSRGSTCASSGRCSRPPARGTTGERVANRSRASRVPNHVSDHAATGGARSLSRTRLGGKLQATRQRVVATALARRAPGAAIPSRKAFVRWARASHLPLRREVAVTGYSFAQRGRRVAV